MCLSWREVNSSGHHTYMCPNSWAMVKAADSPLSCTNEQDSLRQIVPSSARPSVSHLVSLGFRQICSRVRSRAVSWSCLNFSFLIRQKSVNILEASTPGQRHTNKHNISIRVLTKQTNGFHCIFSNPHTPDSPIPLASWATFSCRNIIWTTAILIELPILASAKILDTWSWNGDRGGLSRMALQLSGGVDSQLTLKLVRSS